MQALMWHSLNVIADMHTTLCTTADMKTGAETCVSHWDTAAVTSSNSQSNLLNAVAVTDSSSQEENPREPHELFNDIGVWPVVISTEFADFWIRNGTQQLQNCNDRLFEERSVKQKRIIKTMIRKFIANVQ